MKNAFLFLLVFSFTGTCLAQPSFEYKNFTLTPAKPKPGDKIHFVYQPKEAFPKNRAKVEVEISYWNKSTDNKRGSASYYLVKTVRGWEGTYQISKQARALKFLFNNHFPSWKDTAGLRVDDNGNDDYIVPLYNSQGVVAPGAWISMAWTLGNVNNRTERVLGYATKEAATNGLFNEKVEEAYYTISLDRRGLYKGKDEEVKDDLMRRMKDSASNEARYTYAIKTFRNYFKDGRRADSLLKVRNTLFPYGEWSIAENMLRLLIKYPVDVDSMIYYYNRYRNFLLSQGQTAAAVDKTPALDADVIIWKLGEAERWEEFYAWLDKYDRQPRQEMERGVVDALVRKGKKDAMVLKCAAEMHAAQKKYIDDKDPRWLVAGPYGGSETYDDHVRDNRKWVYINDSKNYADVLLANNKNEEAWQVMQEVMLNEERKDMRTYELYAIAMARATRSPQKTLDKIADFFKQEKGTLTMKEPMKALWLACNKPVAAFEPYFDTLNNYVEIQLRAKLKKEMINEPAPAFALKNLDGQEVTLASLKGKAMVLDFWATWCVPCKASMPAMKKAMANLEHKKIPATFLFIDTWEDKQAAETKQEVGDFIADNKYPFNVLFDEKTNDPVIGGHADNYRVVKDYKVSGIPTKFVIDSKGNIRFKIVGYPGNDDEVIRTVALMIKMAGEEN